MRSIIAGQHGRRAITMMASVAVLTSCGVNEDAVRVRIEEAVSVQPVETVAGASVHWTEDVRSFYGARAMRPAWTNGRGLDRRGRRVLAVLQSVSSKGLRPERYGVPAIRIVRAAQDTASTEEVRADLLRDLDVLITTGLRTYLADLHAGALESVPEETDWPAQRADSTVLHTLRSIAAGADVEEETSALEPDGSQYRALLEALHRYTRIVESGGWPAVEVGEGVAAPVTAAALRARLLAESDSVERALLLAADTAPQRVDGPLAEALAHFQVRHGLARTGELDAQTVAALNTPAEERVAALALNLDRWRAVPRDPGELHVLVNVPAFEMAVIEAGKPVLRMNTVVGKPEHATPVLMDTMEYIVVNPYWNVPPSITQEEILPALAGDDDYLRKRNMEVVDRDGTVQVVDARDIDWDEVEADSFSLSIRQRPGPGNALGDVKFMFPNPRNIYLHDTPETSLFERNVRAFSHGCVRLERPLDLARFVLDRRGGDAGAGVLDALLEQDEEKHVPLTEGIPVYLLYLTVWSDEERGLRFLPDIYARDAQLEEHVAERLHAPGHAVEVALTPRGG